MPRSRWWPWLWGFMAAMGAVRLVVELVGALDGLPLALASGQVVLGVGAAIVHSRTRVRLEPEGYRVGDPLWRGRLRPWSGVAEVRPASRWSQHAEIRGTRAADAPVALAGMTVEQAAELQHRLEEARERATSRGAQT